MDIYKLCEVILANRQKAELLDKLGEVTEEITSSDKVGFNWKVYKVNGIEVSKEYIENELEKGTSADTAINFVEGIEVKPNTYYFHDEKTYVYMGEQKIAESWDDVSEMMAEWFD